MERLRPIQRVDLAWEDDFSLGALEVRPSRCELEAAGVRRAVEPRVMQVLVALAHPTWEVVSIQELTARCWNGLFVSDDAVHRCIRILRRLAAGWREPPFEIETIHRVGYFLKPSAAGNQASPGRLPIAAPVASLATSTNFHRAA